MRLIRMSIFLACSMRALFSSSRASCMMAFLSSFSPSFSFLPLPDLASSSSASFNSRSSISLFSLSSSLLILRRRPAISRDDYSYFFIRPYRDQTKCNFGECMETKSLILNTPLTLCLWKFALVHVPQTECLFPHIFPQNKQLVVHKDFQATTCKVQKWRLMFAW